MYSLTKHLLLLSLSQTILVTPLLRAAAPLVSTNSTTTLAGEAAKKEKAITFVPPQGWLMAEPKELPPGVKIMFVGKGKGVFPPSINLGTESYRGSLEQYIKTIEAINRSQGARWNALGSLSTPAGKGCLYQEESHTKWGEVRMIHLILYADGTIFILTAAAAKEEFATHYKSFLAAMSSLAFIEANGAAKEAS